MCECMRKDHVRHIKDYVVHIRLRWTMKTTKITQHALKVSEHGLHNVEGGHYTEDEEKLSGLTITTITIRFIHPSEKSKLSGSTS